MLPFASHSLTLSLLKSTLLLYIMLLLLISPVIASQASNDNKQTKPQQRRLAIVTGGTRGIGFGIATVLARQGYDLILSYNTNEIAEEESKRRLLDTYPDCHIECVGGDMTLVSTRDQIFSCVDTKFSNNDPTSSPSSELQVLVHNAGQYIGITSDNSEGLDADLVAFGDGSLLRKCEDGMERPNFSSMQYYQRLYGEAWIDLCERCLQRMKGPDGGSFVGISSPSVNPALYRPDRSYSEPGSGKTVMEYSMRIFAKVVAERNINVNVVVPGVVQTDAWDKMEQYRQEGETTEAMLKRLVDFVVPLKRLQQPTDIGELIAFLCSQSGRFITGMTLPADGGQHIR
jgi:NAD(P)-dependent dehydrogenase (short-subunit alcohol dehydrogenase family)